ncbi:cytochrome c oxidase assembly protein COX20, mitochondrial [Phacochoerus africanus]|uniref:cytochrome c oxidase assembly protein COX20, mitochondrial n=1 Tax=Phacochoerus africanus TaxID=41426 RepID=UPI001FDAC01B|nr:cytochrome c oxidase assembly protein COX20, mitochondrial [Phacochoerus africanus]
MAAAAEEADADNAAAADSGRRSLKWRTARRGRGEDAGGASVRGGPRRRRGGAEAPTARMAATPEPGEPGKGKPFKLLGILDVENTPCARESILHGSLGSVVAGLGHFLLTSRIRRSCDVAVGGFILVTLGCWFHCRYNYAKLRIQERVAREGIKNKILYESTHLDPERKTNGSGSSH